MPAVDCPRAAGRPRRSDAAALTAEDEESPAQENSGRQQAIQDGPESIPCAWSFVKNGSE
jgi:hypothetical protein